MTATERACQVVAESLGIDPSEVTLETTFVSLGADSLSKAQLILDLEDEFGAVINDDEAQTIHKVQDVLKYVDSVCTHV